MKLDDDEIIFEWDEAKRQENLRKHGIDFLSAGEIFADPNFTYRVDDRRDYGEVRYIAYGRFGDEVLSVCYTLRGQFHRLISLRKVHQKEQEKYYGNHNQNDHA